MIGLVSKLLAQMSKGVNAAEVQSTKIELVREQQRRRTEHNRTEQLARMLDDYRAQDRVLRRR